MNYYVSASGIQWYVGGDNLLYKNTLYYRLNQYHLYKANGGVVQLTSNSGAVSKKYRYDAYSNDVSMDNGFPEAIVILRFKEVKERERKMSIYDAKGLFLDEFRKLVAFSIFICISCPIGAVLCYHSVIFNEIAIGRTKLQFVTFTIMFLIIEIFYVIFSALNYKYLTKKIIQPQV